MHVSVLHPTNPRAPTGPFYIPESEVNFGFDSIFNGERNDVLRAFTMRVSESVGGDWARWTPEMVRDRFLRERRRFLVPTHDGRYRVLNHGTSKDDKKKIKHAINNIKQTMKKKAKRAVERIMRQHLSVGFARPPDDPQPEPVASVNVPRPSPQREAMFPPIEQGFAAHVMGPTTEPCPYPEYEPDDFEPLPADVPVGPPPELDHDLAILSSLLHDDVSASLIDFDDVVMKDFLLEPVALGGVPPALDAVDVEFASEVFDPLDEMEDAHEEHTQPCARASLHLLETKLISHEV